MPIQLSDNDCIEVLKGVAIGRTAREMAPLLHVAHECVILAAEDDKHAALIANRGTAMSKGVRIERNGQTQFNGDVWNDLVAHLSDGEGTNHIDVALGLVWRAALQHDQVALEMYLYSLVKAAHLTFPHVRKTIEGELTKEEPPIEVDPGPIVLPPVSQ